MHKNRGEKNLPRGDKTGPDSQGPMTGRGLGYCVGYSAPGFMNPNRGYGRGFARRRGRGWGRGFGGRWNVPAYQPIVHPVPTLSPEQEIAALENYQKQLETEKEEIKLEANNVKTRIEELKTKNKK